MSKTKKYSIEYDKLQFEMPSSNAPGSKDFFQCKILSDSDYGNLSLNPNIVNIIFRGQSKPYILSTGHSLGPHACKINGHEIESEEKLSNCLTNTGKYFSLNDTKSDRDFSLITHAIISQIPRTVSFPGKINNLFIPVSGIDKYPDKTKTYYKYGKTTGVTSAKIFLMLQNQKAQDTLSKCKIKSGKSNIYQIPDYENNCLRVISHSSNGVDDNITNKDFLLVHGEDFYINTHFNEELEIEPNYQLYIYLAGFLSYLGFESNTHNKTVLANIIKSNSIGTKWFETKRVGWVSLMGDSGSGFYSVDTDETGNQTAQLLGINVEGCTMINIRQLSNPVKLTENIQINWDKSKSQLTIGNWEILSAQKCSLAHSIPHIGQMIEEIVGEPVVLE